MIDADFNGRNQADLTGELKALSRSLRADWDEIFVAYGNYDSPSLGSALSGIINALAPLLYPMKQTHHDIPEKGFDFYTSGTQCSPIADYESFSSLGFTKEEWEELYEASLEIFDVEKTIAGKLNPVLAATSEDFDREDTFKMMYSGYKGDLEVRITEIPEKIIRDVPLSIGMQVSQQSKDVLLSALNKISEQLSVENRAPADLVNDIRRFADMAKIKMEDRLLEPTRVEKPKFSLAGGNDFNIN